MENINKKIRQIFRLSMHINQLPKCNYNVYLSVSSYEVGIVIDENNKIIFKEFVKNFKDNPSGKELQLNRIVKLLVKLKAEN